MSSHGVLGSVVVTCALACAAAASADPPLPELPTVPPIQPPTLPPEGGPAPGSPSPSPRRVCDRYASPHGSTRSRGTFKRPFRTVERLARSLHGGMTGCLRRGTYREDLKVGRGGRSGAPVVIRPFGTERARIVGRMWIARRAHHVTIRGLYLDGRNARHLPSPTVNGAHVTFEHNDVTNRHTGICFGLGTHAYGRARDTAIRANRIHDCGRMPRTNHDHGIYVEQARGTVIEDNWIYRNADRGIQLYPNAQRTVVRRNVIHGNATGIVFSGRGGETSNGSLVEYNVITGSVARYNVESYWPTSRIGRDNQVRFNCLSGARRGRAAGGVQLPAVGFTLGENAISVPRYRAPRHGDFRIEGGGACAALLGSPQTVPGPPAR
jgi:parallel beta-helix repeat protein